MSGQRTRKYAAYARFALTRVWNERANLAARMMLLPLFLGIFSALWNAIHEGKMPINTSSRQMVWYLAVTQWVLFSVPHPEFDLEQQVRRGDIAYQLVRPSSLFGATFAEGLGTLALQAPAFALAAFGSALLFTGALPAHPSGLLFAIPLGLCGAVVLLLFQIALGLSAFWFRSVGPLGWIWSKATFILGGLMLPLPLYPPWLERIAMSTPFAHALYGPASYLLDDGTKGIHGLFLGQLGWLLVALSLGFALHRAAINALTIDGG